MVCPLFGGLSSFGVSFIGGFTVDHLSTTTITTSIQEDYKLCGGSYSLGEGLVVLLLYQPPSLF